MRVSAAAVVLVVVAACQQPMSVTEGPQVERQAVATNATFAIADSSSTSQTAKVSTSGELSTGDAAARAKLDTANQKLAGLSYDSDSNLKVVSTGTSTVTGNVGAMQQGDWSVGIRPDGNTVKLDPTTTPSVNVANTASVTVANTPAVTVANTPAVTLANTPTVNIGTMPAVNVAPTGPRARVMLWAPIGVADTVGSATLNFHPATGANTASFVVPAATQVVIEQASFSCALPPSQTAIVNVMLLPANNFPPVSFPVPSQQVTTLADGTSASRGSSALPLYLSPGDGLAAFFQRSSTASTGSCTVFLFGYSVAAP